jgi:hypothetical protein
VLVDFLAGNLFVTCCFMILHQLFLYPKLKQ